MSEWLPYLYLSALWILWCAVHSWMISISFTGFAKRIMGESFRYYRIIFNTFALASLIGVAYYSRTIDAQMLFVWDGYWHILRWALIVLASVFFFAGARQYDMLQFAGIRQMMTGKAHAVLSEGGELQISGVGKITRHPWYLATIFIVWSYRDISTTSLVTSIILTVYLIVGSILEEQKLIKEFGQAYRDYQKNVSILFPFKYIMSLVQ